MIIKLKEVSKIFPGMSFRHRIRNDVNGKYKLILMRNISDDNSIDYKKLTVLNIPNVKQEQFLKKGDILFRAKGNHNFASHIHIDLENTITNSHFLIVRTLTDTVLPEYIAWFINQTEAQHYFFKHSPGTVIPIVTKRTLENLNITIPDLKTQKKIVELFKLSLKEQKLVEKISHKRRFLIDSLLKQKLKGGK